MLIKELQIVGIRSFEGAGFTFQSGMNLVVGINGVGKTTVLDVIRICLSKVLPEITDSHAPKLSFVESDFRVNAEAIQVFCSFELEGKQFSYTYQRKSQISINTPDNSEETTKEEYYVFENINRPSGVQLPNYKKSRQQPLAIYFSTRRSLINDKTTYKERALGEQAAAFAESLSPDRELRLRRIAEWYRAQLELGNEIPIALKHIDVLQKAIVKFLPHFHNLRIDDSQGSIGFMVDKQGVPLKFTQLSDGERGVMAIVLDLARRLSQANPGLEDPIRDGVAIVMIDELDLHLHPKWQRSIVENLKRTFQNCQFIASTHSPQIIPAVEPEQVQLLKDNKVIRPDRTLGMDSNWILRNLMETDERPEEAANAIEKVEYLISEGDYEAARNEIEVFRQQGLDLPEWSALDARITRFEMFGEE